MSDSNQTVPCLPLANWVEAPILETGRNLEDRFQDAEEKGSLPFFSRKTEVLRGRKYKSFFFVCSCFQSKLTKRLGMLHVFWTKQSFFNLYHLVYFTEETGRLHILRKAEKKGIIIFLREHHGRPNTHCLDSGEECNHLVVENI